MGSTGGDARGVSSASEGPPASQPIPPYAAKASAPEIRDCGWAVEFGDEELEFQFNPSSLVAHAAPHCR